MTAASFQDQLRESLGIGEDSAAPGDGFAETQDARATNL